MNLATRRLDEFVWLYAEETGRVLTKPFMFQGEELYVNVDAKWGDIRVKSVKAVADLRWAREAV